MIKFAHLIFLLVVPLCAYAQNIYVATNGDDQNSGTKEKPVATLEAARDLVRQYKAINDVPKGGITVWIGEGRYDQKKPLVLNGNDSGEPDVPITWRTLPDNYVSITGGRSIDFELFSKVENQLILNRLSKKASENVLQVILSNWG